MAIPLGSLCWGINVRVVFLVVDEIDGAVVGKLDAEGGSEDSATGIVLGTASSLSFLLVVLESKVQRKDKSNGRRITKATLGVIWKVELDFGPPFTSFVAVD